MEFTGIQRLRDLPYPDYLQTSLWLSTRRLAILLADGQCEKCHKKENLDVYHKNFDQLGQETKKDIVVLCPLCSKDNNGNIDLWH